jgi:hypothetical protein
MRFTEIFLLLSREVGCLKFVLFFVEGGKCRCSTAGRRQHLEGSRSRMLTAILTVWLQLRTGNEMDHHDYSER